LLPCNRSQKHEPHANGRTDDAAIVHPATTTHGRLSLEQKEEAGITGNLIRVAVGLEDIDDLKEDLLQGLKAL
jgi:O-succinylhomoserine sulfhydrylase